MTRAERYYVTILSSTYGVLYVGVTRDLRRRLLEHRGAGTPGFTARYRIGRLVYWEETSDIRSAIARVKEIKGWRRQKKLDLIRTVNPRFRDLARVPDE